MSLLFVVSLRITRVSCPGCLISGLVFVGSGSFESREYLKGSFHDFQECEYIKFCFRVEAFFVVSVELVKTMKVTLRYF